MGQITPSCLCLQYDTVYTLCNARTIRCGAIPVFVMEHAEVRQGAWVCVTRQAEANHFDTKTADQLELVISICKIVEVTICTL